MKFKLTPVAALNRLIGILFLIWSFFAGGYLLRFLLLGEATGLWYDVFGYVIGALTVIVLVLLWRKIADDDRAYIVKTLWVIVLAIAVNSLIHIYTHE